MILKGLSVKTLYAGPNTLRNDIASPFPFAMSRLVDTDNLFGVEGCDGRLIAVISNTISFNHGFIAEFAK